MIDVRKSALVAWREYLENVRTKAFLLGVLLTPLLMTGIIVAPMLFPQEDRRLAIVDGTGELHALLKSALEEGQGGRRGGKTTVIDDPDAVIAPASAGAAARLAAAEERLQARVQAGGKGEAALDGALVIEPDFFTDDQAVRTGKALRYHTLKPTDRTLPQMIEQTLAILRRPLRSKQLAERRLRLNPLGELATIPIAREVVGAEATAAGGGGRLRVHVCDGTGLVLPSLQAALGALLPLQPWRMDDWPAPAIEGAERVARVRLLQMGLDPAALPSAAFAQAAEALGAGGEGGAEAAPVSFDEARAAFLARMEAGEIDVVLAVRRELLSRAAGPGAGDATLLVRPGLDPVAVAALETICRQVLWLERAQAEMLAVNVTPSLAVLNPEKKGERYETADVAAKLLVPLAFVILLFYGVFGIAQALLNSVIEEKANRIIEVLLSSLTPLELMLGKIVGTGLVGLTLVVLWGAGGYLTAWWQLGSGFLSLYVRPELLVWFAVYYTLGFLFLASLIAAVGATCNTIKDAQNYMAVVSILYVIPILTLSPVAEQPEGTMAKVLSFIPPLTPFVMMNRLAASKTIPWTEVALSIALLVISLVAAIWVAARIFRVGILLYGKPPRPLEILKWLRRA